MKKNTLRAWALCTLVSFSACSSDPPEAEDAAVTDTTTSEPLPTTTPADAETYPAEQDPRYSSSSLDQEEAAPKKVTKKKKKSKKVTGKKKKKKRNR